MIHPAWAGSGSVWIPGGCNPSVWVRSGWIRWILWVRGSAALCQRRRLRDARGYAGLIAARELPRDRTTLLVRLMAAGPLLASAVPEVARLPADAAERAVAEPILLQFERMLGQQATRTSDEQEFLTAMQHTWEDARTESRTETQAKAVLTVLRVRGIAVPDAARQRIQAERDLARLERWHERAIVASSIAEVIDDDPNATR